MICLLLNKNELYEKNNNCKFSWESSLHLMDKYMVEKVFFNTNLFLG